MKERESMIEAVIREQDTLEQAWVMGALEAVIVAEEG